MDNCGFYRPILRYRVTSSRPYSFSVYFSCGYGFMIVRTISTTHGKEVDDLP